MTFSKLFRFFILLLVLPFAACRSVEVDPPAPEGTLFPGGSLGFGNTITEGTDGACTSNCVAGVLPGFRAKVSKTGDPLTLESGEGNTVGLSSTGFITLQAQMFDGILYTFNFAFPGTVGKFKVVGLRQWGPEPFTSAGFQYAEGVTGSATISSTAEGNLSVQSVSGSRVIGTFNGSTNFDGQDIPVTAEFNVAVQQQ
jgi:hypothetical protein